MGNVTVIGSSNIDLVIKSGLLPQPGQTVLGGDFFQAFGGKGANQAVAAARAGAHTAFIGKVGKDSFGDQMKHNLKADGIDISGLAADPDLPSGAALIMVNEEGENIISVAPGANSRLLPDDIEKNSALIQKADIILLQLEIPLETVYRAIDIAAEGGTKVILNPAPAPNETFSPDHLRSVSCCIPNKGELEILTGAAISSEKDLEKAVSDLSSRGVDTVLVTLGSEGVFYFDKGSFGTVPSKKVVPVDTVGAGDCFSGCFAAALSDNIDLVQAVEFAVAGAAVSVTRMGAQPSLPARDEIENMLCVDS